MKVAVLKEARAEERRVPIVPDSVKRLRAKKIDVVVEAGAGARARAPAAE
jgi:NAD(P) transhydrogenase subunit alpha